MLEQTFYLYDGFVVSKEQLDASVLPDDYRPVYRKVVKEAQQMIADGIIDARD